MEGNYWVTTAYEDEDEPEGEKERLLEVEVATLKKELAEVRKDLAAKTVQLSKRDAGDKAAQEKWAEQRVAELAAAQLAPKEQLVRSLELNIVQLEVNLAQRTEELDESRRLFASQKRALKDALSAAAEREADAAEADAAGQSAATAAAEEEMERLHQELAQLQTRAALELQAKDSEIQQLKQQIAEHMTDRQKAVAAAEALAAAAHQQSLAEAVAAHAVQLADVQAELHRARSREQRYIRDSQEDYSPDMATVNKEKMQLQREFDAFKDLTAGTHRQHREEQARLLEENAALKARIAGEAARAAMGVPAVTGGSIGGIHSSRGKTFAAVSDGVSGSFEQLIGRLERQRRGLVPVLVIGSLVLLILLIAVLRAAASARGEHKGAVCFLSKLGVQIGSGCSDSSSGSSSLGTPSKAVAAALSDLVEATPRVKDVEGPNAAASGLQKDSSVVDDSKGGTQAAETRSSNTDSGKRRLLWRDRSHMVRWRKISCRVERDVY